MTDVQQRALEAKNQGNAAFTSGRFEEAVKHFTEAISLDSTNHILYSNRSGSYASLKQYQQALEDAQKTVELKGDWPKGYSRLGSALFFLGRFEEATEAYDKGLQLEPNNPQLLQGAQEARSAVFSKKLSSAFQGDLISKISKNPKFSGYLNQPDFLAKVAQIQANPQTLLQHLNDPRIAGILSLLAGLDAEEDEPQQEEIPTQTSAQTTPTPAQTPSSTPSAESSAPKAPEPELTPEQKEAEKWKESGNEAYKNKKFEEAIGFYDKAIELVSENLTYKLNRSAALFEKGDLEACIEQCNKIVEEGRAHYADYKLIAKALFRLGNAYMKQEKYGEAVEAYNKSLTEHRIAPTLTALKKAEKLKKEKEDREYLNPAISLEEKEKGNEEFKHHRFPEAIKYYTEALRRNPSDHTIYSNRAAAYTKLGELDYALKDCEQCLTLSPTFVKGYIRKGLVYYMMKNYRKAMETYDAGLKLDGENAELLEGARKAVQAIQGMQNSGAVDQETLKRAMADPEIQAILQDPTIQKVISNPDPAALSDPDIAAKLSKLASAGVIRLG